jgi:hypothetical protein
MQPLWSLLENASSVSNRLSVRINKTDRQLGVGERVGR